MLAEGVLSPAGGPAPLSREVSVLRRDAHRSDMQAEGGGDTGDGGQILLQSVEG